MKLSWIGRSAIVVAGVIVLALVGLQVFYPTLYDNSHEFVWFMTMNIPIMVLASISALDFLKKTKKMPKIDRYPWETYSWFVLGFTCASIFILIVSAIDSITSPRGPWIFSLSILPIVFLAVSFLFILGGLVRENDRQTEKKARNILWVFGIVALVLIGTIFIPKITIVFPKYVEKILFAVVFLVLIYLCMSIIMKNDRLLGNIYKIVLGSQIIFYILGIVGDITGKALFEIIQFSILFFSFAVVFDLRKSLYQLEESKTTVQISSEAM